MYVEFTKNFYLADSKELFSVTLISTSLTQKRLIPTCYTWCMSCSRKILISPIRTTKWLLYSFRHPEPKNVWFLLSRPPQCKNFWLQLTRHDLCRVHEKHLSCRFETAIVCYTHFDLFNPKTFDSNILDMMYVEFMKNSYFAHSNNLNGSYIHFGILSPKKFDSYFLDMMYIEFVKNFHMADMNKVMAVWFISTSWAQKHFIRTF